MNTINKIKSSIQKKSCPSNEQNSNKDVAQKIPKIIFYIFFIVFICSLSKYAFAQVEVTETENLNNGNNNIEASKEPNIPTKRKPSSRRRKVRTQDFYVRSKPLPKSWQSIEILEQNVLNALRSAIHVGQQPEFFKIPGTSQSQMLVVNEHKRDADLIISAAESFLQLINEAKVNKVNITELISNIRNMNEQQISILTRYVPALGFFLGVAPAISATEEILKQNQDSSDQEIITPEEASSK